MTDSELAELIKQAEWLDMNGLEFAKLPVKATLAVLKELKALRSERERVRVRDEKAKSRE